MDHRRVLDSIVSALAGHASGHGCVDRPSFDGTNALQFNFAFEHYCSISNIAPDARLQEMIKCATKASVARKIQRECVQVRNGIMTPFSWRDVRRWFEATYPVGGDGGPGGGVGPCCLR